MKYLLIFLLAGCTQSFSGEPTNQYDHYLIEFNQDLEALGQPMLDFKETFIIRKDLGIDFARCAETKVKKSGPTVIYINAKIMVSKEIFALLLYHEIGHCFYGLEHSAGIMSETISDAMTKEDRLKLIKQMISKN